MKAADIFGLIVRLAWLCLAAVFVLLVLPSTLSTLGSALWQLMR